MQELISKNQAKNETNTMEVNIEYVNILMVLLLLVAFHDAYVELL